MFIFIKNDEDKLILNTATIVNIYGKYINLRWILEFHLCNGDISILKFSNNYEIKEFGDFVIKLAEIINYVEANKQIIKTQSYKIPVLNINNDLTLKITFDEVEFI